MGNPPASRDPHGVLVTDPDLLLPLLVQSTHTFASKLEQISVLLPQRGEHDPRDDATRRMTKRAAQLVSACAVLAPQLRNEAIVILERAVLENLFTLLWVIGSPDRPERFRSESLDELRRAARKNMERGLLGIFKRPNAEDRTKEFLQRRDFKEIPRRISVEQRAKEAGVHSLYSVFYSMLSMELHGFSLEKVDPRPAASTCASLQSLGAFSNCTAIVAESWLTERKRPTNEQLRGALGLPFESDDP